MMSSINARRLGGMLIIASAIFAIREGFLTLFAVSAPGRNYLRGHLASVGIALVVAVCMSVLQSQPKYHSVRGVIGIGLISGTLFLAAQRAPLTSELIVFQLGVIAALVVANLAAYKISDRV